jgi:hypothetical protein
MSVNALAPVYASILSGNPGRTTMDISEKEEILLKLSHVPGMGCMFMRR